MATAARVGACSIAAMRLHALEQKLVGVSADQAAGHICADDLAVLAPIDDVRATAEYRRDAALTLVKQALARAVTA